MSRAQRRERRFALLVGGHRGPRKAGSRKRRSVRNVVRGAPLGSGAITVKILDVTEFYSERGGGVRSHLSLKGHVLCQLGHEHVVIAPGSHDVDEQLAREGSQSSPRLARSGGGARVIRIAGPASPYDPTY